MRDPCVTRAGPVRDPRVIEILTRVIVRKEGDRNIRKEGPCGGGRDEEGRPSSEKLIEEARANRARLQ